MKHLNNTKAMITLAASLFIAATSFAQQHVLAHNALNAPMTEGTFADEKPNTLQLNVLQATDESLTFHISIDNPNLERVKLFVTDHAGNILHEEVLPVKARYESRYNLEMLEDGKYSIVISTREKNISHEINIHTAVSRVVSVL